MKDSGYELYFGGKEHLPQPLRPIHQGFDKYCDDERELLATKTAELIKKPHNQPWLTVVSLINPHDICYMAIRDYHQKRNEYPPMIKKAKKEIIQLDKALKVPENIEKEEFIREHCPPLRENESPQEKESHAIQHLVSLRPFKQNARDFYTESDWRLHRWAYCRLTEVVDQEIGIILTALRESGQEENTLVMLSSDHGDMDGAHKLEHKTAFYEESANVPFVAMLRGQIAEGKVDKTHLISNGLDFLPTVCDYVGVDKGTSDSRGRSLRPLFEETNVEWRKTIGIESELGWSVVNEKGLKYNRYDVKGFEQELFDLKNDTGEMKPITEEKEFSKDLAALQEDMEKNWFPYSKVKG